MLLFADSFDHYGSGSAGYANLTKGPGAYGEIGSDTYVGISSAQKRTGAYSLSMNTNANGGTVGFRKSIVAANNEVIAGFGLYLSALPASSSKICFQWLQGTTPVASLIVTSAGALRLLIGGSSGTLVAQTDNIIAAGTFNHIEIRALRDDVVGELEARVNGVQVAFIDNLDLGDNDIDGFQQIVPANGSGVTTYIDDLTICDTTGTAINDFMGPVRVNTSFVSADTVEADWTKNTGTDGYALIDDIAPDGDATYLEADTIGEVSEFALSALPSETADIKGVYIPAMARLADAGIGNLQVSLVSNSEVSLGPNEPITTSYAYYGSVHELNPDGDIPWTKASLEAALLRIEKTA